MIDFVLARKKMVENQLRTSGITDRRLLAAMAQEPREQFVPEAWRDLAYIDEALPLTSSGTPRYLPAPAPFGRLVQLASVATDDRVLDVGCGTGYSTAVLASLAARVVALESDPDLAAAARSNLAAFDNVTVMEGALDAGVQSEAPFDVILLEGAVDSVPKGHLDQLADGGRLVVLVRQGAAAAAHLFVRSGRDVAGRVEFNTNLPALPAGNRPAEFVF